MVGQEQESLCSVSAFYRPDDPGCASSTGSIVGDFESDSLGEDGHAACLQSRVDGDAGRNNMGEMWLVE